GDADELCEGAHAAVDRAPYLVADGQPAQIRCLMRSSDCAREIDPELLREAAAADESQLSRSHEQVRPIDRDSFDAHEYPAKAHVGTGESFYAQDLRAAEPIKHHCSQLQHVLSSRGQRHALSDERSPLIHGNMKWSALTT